MFEKWIAESTECDFKVALEVKKPKSWLKSISPFANGIGGTLLFGIDDQRRVIGINNVQNDIEIISTLIKERITPYPDFNLSFERIDDKNIIILNVHAGLSTPYYYKANGIMQAYIRAGNTSIIAPSYILNQLILKGMNRSFDTLITEYSFNDYSFTKLKERYKSWTGISMEDKLFDSFELRNAQNNLTNTGALLADNSPIKHSRLFCTRWNGLDKSGGMIDVLDSAEYAGSLIILLNEGISFIKRNMKTYWKKTPNSRIEMPDYCERSIFEALVNALIHRDYTITGSEIHIDIYDNRLVINSPGGMIDGTRIQERDLSNISSSRRNPILADIFARLGYMERQGSGFRKITDAYYKAHNYHIDLKPEFYSDSYSFQVTLYNLNYKKNKKIIHDHEHSNIQQQNVLIDDQKVAIGDKKVAIDQQNVLFGDEKVAIAQRNVSIGDQKVAIGQKKVSIGDKKVAIDDEDVSIDDDETMSNNQKVAIEGEKVAIGQRNVSIGDQKVAIAQRNVLIDDQKVAIEGEKVAIDDDETTPNNQKVAIGQKKVSIGVQKVAIAQQNVSIEDEKVTIGDKKVAIGQKKVLIDDQKVSIEDEKVAIGQKKVSIGVQKVAIDDDETTPNDQKVAIDVEKVAIEGDIIINTIIERLNTNQTTINKIKEVFKEIGLDRIFGRTDIMVLIGGSATTAGKLIVKLKDAGLIMSVSGYGKGKYRFIVPDVIKKKED